MVEEHCQQQLQEELIEAAAEFSEGLSEFSDISIDFCPSLLIEESSGKEEEPQKPNHKPLPTKLNPSTTAQATKSPMLAAPSLDQVYILPSPAAQSTPKTPAAKAKANPSLLVRYLKKLVASVQAFATTSKTLAAAHTAWHRDGSGAGSDMEHLDLSNSISSISSNSLQRLERLVLGGGSVSPTFCFNFPALLYFILFYFDLFKFSL